MIICQCVDILYGNQLGIGARFMFRGAINQEQFFYEWNRDAFKILIDEG